MPPTATGRAMRTRGALLVGALALVLTGCRVTPPPEKSCTVGVLGDSLTLGAQGPGRLEEALDAFGCELAWVDAATGRRTSQGVALLEERNAEEVLPYALVIGLGTNDGTEADEIGEYIDRVMALANGRKVAWIDVAHLPVRSTINPILARKARQYPHLSVIGWNEPYWANPTWRGTDGIHATSVGYLARSELMAEHAAVITK